MFPFNSYKVLIWQLQKSIHIKVLRVGEIGNRKTCGQISWSEGVLCSDSWLAQNQKKKKILHSWSLVIEESKVI